MPMIRRLASLAFLLLLAGTGMLVWQSAGAQEDDSEEKGRFTRFVEDTISTPDRQISIGNIEGVLSSDVRISAITIADREGVWLTINDVHLVWSRLALLRGRLDVDLLEAESIVMSRAPLPAESVDPAADEGFALPELPVEIAIDRLAVPQVRIAESVIGESVALSIAGAVSLEEGTLDAELAVERTDDKPGRLALDANYADETGRLDLDLSLEEPENGVIANLLGIPGRPSVAFAVEGSGPVDDFAADISLSADGQRLVAGQAATTSVEGGWRFVLDIDGNLAPLVPAAYADYVTGTSQLAIDATRAADGAIVLQQADLSSGVASLTASGRFAPDGFPTALNVEGRLGEANAEPVILPGGTAAVDAADFAVSFGGTADRWEATFDLSSLDTGELQAGRATIRAEGVAQNLADPGERRLTFTVDGQISQLDATDPDLARALGDAFQINARGSWASGEPVEVEIAEIQNPNAAVHFAGTVDGTESSGRYWLNAAEIAPLSGLVGQDLSGAVTLEANGTVGLGTGAFALTIDSETVDLSIGNPSIDPLLTGRTTLVGGAFRTAEGLRFEDLRVENANLNARLDGVYDLDRADLTVAAELDDVGLITDRASGSVGLAAEIVGDGETPTINARLSAPDLDLQGRTLTDGLVRFDGVVGTDTIAGTIAISGALDGVPVEGSAEIAGLEDGTRVLEDLTVAADGTTIAGTVAMSPAGLFTGDVAVSSPDVSVIAPLLLIDAAGALQAEIELAVEDGAQVVSVDASARDLRIEENRIESADVDLIARNVFGVPRVEGQVQASGIVAAGLTVDELSATASLEGDTTTFDVAADLEAGRLQAEGDLSAVDGGFDVTMRTLQLTREPDLTAALQLPVTISIRGDAITIPGADLAVGDGRVTINGTIAETLDLTAVVNSLPVDLANAVAPDLALGGLVNGTLEASGPRADPQVDFDVVVSDFTAQPLAEAGIDQIDVSAEGTYAQGTLRLDAATDIAGGTVSVEGSIGETLDVNATVVGLPLALANAYAPDLGVSGTVSGEARATGSLSDPTVAFDVAADDVSAAPLRDAGVDPIDVTAEGTYANGTARITAATTVGGGRLTAEGSIGETLDLEVEVADLPLGLASAYAPDLALSGTVSGEARATGSLSDPTVAFDVAASGVSAAPLREAGVEPIDVTAEGTYANGTARIAAATTVGSGRLTAAGSIGDNLDLEVDIADLPLSLASAYAPDLALSGTVSGDVAATGSLSDPTVAFDLTANDVSAAPIRQAGLAPIDVTAEGIFADGTLAVEAATAIGGGRITVSGTAGDTLDLDVVANGISASLANAAVPDLGASGTVSATADVTGTPSAPIVTFEAEGSGLTARPAAAAGLPPLSVSLDGRYETGAVTLDGTVSGGGLQLDVDGRVPVSGPGLSVSIDGSLPLGLADTALAARGARVTGTAAVDVDVTGSLQAPVIRGGVTVTDATFTDPDTDTRLTGVNLRLALDGNRAVIEQFSARTAGEGTVTASGSIGIAPGSQFPADITIAFQNARVSDGNLLTARIGGRLTITGPLLGRPLVAGTIDVARAEITVPESLPRTATLLDVRHRLPPPNVRRTLERADLLSTAQAADDDAVERGVNLDVTINAPNQVFIRGRGIDAEVGGSLTVRGPISDLRPVGSFELIRGRVSVIGQRIDFDRGSVTLAGDLDPFIDLVASTRSNGITVTATITGYASDPQIVLSSSPELPQDEILAQFLFGRSISDLSPLQIANLATAVAQLGGAGGGGGLLEGIRSATGLDDLDIVTDDEGNAAVRAGRYVSENVYLGVVAGANGESSVSVNLDITENLKARAEVGPQSGSKFGVFYEREY